MAHTLSTAKRIRQNKKRRDRNRIVKSKVRTLVKRVQSAVEKKDKDAAQSAFRLACSQIDKAALKGVIHRNAAARQKTRLSHQINRIGAAS